MGATADRRRAANGYARRVAERIEEIARERGLHARDIDWEGEPIGRASDRYMDALTEYEQAGGEAARDRLRGAARALLEAWRTAPIGRSDRLAPAADTGSRRPARHQQRERDAEIDMVEPWDPPKLRY